MHLVAYLFFMIFVALIATGTFAADGQTTKRLFDDLDWLEKAYEDEDFETALGENRALAERGNPNGFYGLAGLYTGGFGVPRDRAEGIKWLKMAARCDVPEAQQDLGFAYQYARGVPRDYVLAHMWYEIGAGHGVVGVVDFFYKDIEGIMTADEIARAQRLAKDWKPAAVLTSPDDTVRCLLDDAPR